MEVSHENGTHRIKFGDGGELEVQEIVSFGREDGQPARLASIFHPAGEDLTIAKATKSHIQRVRHRLRFRGPLRLRQPVSPGRPELGGSAAQRPLGDAHGSSAPSCPARRAARAGRGGLAGHRRPDGRHGVDAGDGPGRPGLLRHGLGRDDGGDDVPVGRADRAHVRPVAGGPPRTRQGRGARTRRRCSSPATSVVWTAAGLAAYGLFELVRAIDPDFLAWDEAGRYVTGGVIVAAAIYQVTPLKQACLVKCRSPMMFLAERWRHGRAGGLELGMRHGAWCLGCCWALMAALFAVGVMSLGWMALIAAFIAAEKLLPWPSAARRAVAVLLLAARPRGGVRSPRTCRGSPSRTARCTRAAAATATPCR